MLSGRTFQREGATYLKACWPYRFVLESLGPGTSRRDLDADLRRREGLGRMHTMGRMGDAALAAAVLYPGKATQISCTGQRRIHFFFFFKGGRINLLWVSLYHFLIFKLLLQFIITTPTNEK